MKPCCSLQVFIQAFNVQLPCFNCFCKSCIFSFKGNLWYFAYCINGSCDKINNLLRCLLPYIFLFFCCLFCRFSFFIIAFNLLGNYSIRLCTFSRFFLFLFQVCWSNFIIKSFLLCIKFGFVTIFLNLQKCFLVLLFLLLFNLIICLPYLFKLKFPFFSNCNKFFWIFIKQSLYFCFFFNDFIYNVIKVFPS